MTTLKIIKHKLNVSFKINLENRNFKNIFNLLILKIYINNE